MELVAAPSEDSPWCKIAPPPGEFRWIFSKYVDREMPSEIAQDEREAATGRGYITARDDEAQDGNVQLTSAGSAVAGERADTARHGRRPH